MTRVLNIVTTFRPGGGIETFLWQVYQRAQRDDLAHTVCVVGREVGELADECRGLGIEVWHCPFDLKNPWSFGKRFERGLKARKAFDVVHAHLLDFSGPALRVARKMGVPRRIAHYHNTRTANDRGLRKLMRRWMQRDVRRCATSIVACSWAALQAYYPNAWHTDERMDVIRLGIPVREIQAEAGSDEVRSEFQIPSDAYLLGHTGRFQHPKNQEAIIDVVAKLVDREPRVHALLIGDGHRRSLVEARAEERGVRDRIVFAGLRRDVYRLLGAMDMFVFPSLHEGFGIVLLEAQAAGVPVVASDIPAMREAVAPGYRPFLRPPTEPEQLTEAIEQLRERVEQDPELRTAARDYAAQFTIENSVASMLATWGVPGVSPPPDPCGGRSVLLGKVTS